MSDATDTSDTTTEEPRIELVQLANGEIVLRSSDNPEEPLVVINITDQVQDLMPMDKIDIAQAMIEAGIERYRDIQVERIEEAHTANSGLLH